MLMKFLTAATGFLLAAAIPITSVADTPPPSSQEVGANLPDNIRSLLIQEMIAIRGASQQILDALTQGQDDVVAVNAQAIHDSFIMAQKMSSADKKVLVEAVPAEFLQKDEAFHKLSADLATAARAGDGPEQRQLFAELINACTACHAAHARDRFPGFASVQ